MPEKAERNLRAKARSKGLTGERFNKYVYGGLRAMGWKPKRKRNGLKRSGKKHGLKRSMR